MRLVVHHDVFLGLLISLGSIGLLLMSAEFPGETARFPKVILSFFGFCGFWTLFKGIVKTRLLSQGKNDEVPDKPVSLASMGKPFLCLLSVIAYVLGIKFLGFFASTTVFLVAFMYIAKVNSWTKIVLVTMGANVFLYLLFVQQLHVQLPAGLLR